MVITSLIEDSLEALAFDEDDVPTDVRYGDWQAVGPGRAVWELVYFVYQSNIGYKYDMQMVLVTEYFNSLTKNGVKYEGGLKRFTRQYWINMLAWCINVLSMTMVPIFHKPATMKALSNKNFDKTLSKTKKWVENEKKGKKVPWKNPTKKLEACGALFQPRIQHWATELIAELMVKEPELYNPTISSSDVVSNNDNNASKKHPLGP